MSYPPPQQPGYAPNYNYPPQGMSYQPGQPAQPTYYPPPNPGYYPQGQPQMGYQQTVVTQQVITQQPTAQHISCLQFRQAPTRVICPHCNNIIKTQITRKIGGTTFICCAVLSLVCCCCCPFFLDCTKDAEHSCPNCKHHLGLFKQPLVQSGGGSGRHPKYDHSNAYGPGDDGTGRGPTDYGDGGSCGGGSCGGGSGGGCDD